MRRSPGIAAALLGVLAAALPAGAGSTLDAEGTLAWLRTRQAEDGGWGEGDGASDVGVTATCLLAHLAAGYTHRGGSETAPALQRGYRHLKRAQAEDGAWVGGWEDHAWATLAFMEGYGMTRSPLLKGAALRGWERLSIAVRAEPAFARDARLAAVALLCRATATALNRQERELRERHASGKPSDRPPVFAPHREADDVLARWTHATAGDGMLPMAVTTLARILFDGTEWADARLAADARWFAEHPPRWDGVPTPERLLAWRTAAAVVVELGGAAYRSWRTAAKAWPALRSPDGPGGAEARATPERDDGPGVEVAATLVVTLQVLTPCYALPEPIRGAR